MYILALKHLQYRVVKSGFQTVGCNLLVGHEINLVGHKWHFKNELEQNMSYQYA